MVCIMVLTQRTLLCACHYVLLKDLHRIRSGENWLMDFHLFIYFCSLRVRALLSAWFPSGKRDKMVLVGPRSAPYI